MIGIIISDEVFDIENTFKVLSYDDASVAPLDLPVLYVGYSATKKLFQNNINVLDNKIREDVFWSMSQNEDLKRFHYTLFEFKLHCYKRVISGLGYKFINNFEFSDFQLVIKEVSLIKDSVCVVNKSDNDSMLFLYDYHKNIIMGFSSKFLKFEKGDLFQVLVDTIKTNNTLLNYDDLPQIVKNHSTILDTNIYSPFLYKYYNFHKN